MTPDEIKQTKEDATRLSVKETNFYLAEEIKKLRLFLQGQAKKE